MPVSLWVRDMKGRPVKFAVLLLFLLNCPFYTCAAELPEGFLQLIDILPQETRTELPDSGVFEDSEGAAEALLQMLDARHVLSLGLQMIKDGLLSSVKLFASLCGLLIVSSVISALCRSFLSEALLGAYSFCSATVIFASVIHMQREHILAVELFFERLTAMMSAMVPVTGAIWAMGGNVTTASVGTTQLYVFVSICEGMCAKSIVPVCCAFTALAICNTLCPDMGLRGLIGAFKKIYSFSLGLIMTLLVASLSAQTTLTAAADCTAARAARLVSANVIPVVGGSVGETLRTVATGVQYLKGVVGVWGIVFIALLTLPVFLSLVLTRLAFLLAAGVADMLGCETEEKLLTELGGIYAIMVAVVSVSAVMFIFALTIFTKTAVAVM